MKDIVHGIKVDYSRDELFSESGLGRLKDGYLNDEEQSPQERFAFVSKTFSSNQEHAERLYNYSSKMWLSYATPVLSYGKTKRSLPISCYGSYLDDSMESILETSSETRMLAVTGGGVGLHVGLRPGDKKSSGIIPHLKTYDVDTLAFKQGTTRRGATAAYLDIDHPEIVDFLEMRKPTGGDPNRKCLNLHHGVNIKDDFMRRIEKLSLHGSELSETEKEELDRYPLINPHSKEIVEYVSARELWERVLTIRMETGEPYIWFVDTVNDSLPDYQKKLGLTNNGSNLCFSGDTLVSVADGRNAVTIEKLANESLGIYQFPVYSSRFNNKGQWVSEIKNAIAFKTGERKTITVTLSDGSSFKCTEEHMLALPNGEYIEAKDSLGVELQPFYSGYSVSSIHVESIEYNDEVESVYDLTVEDNHNFNIITKTLDENYLECSGILVHNCSEISLATSLLRSFVCCLSSVNLEKYDEWKDNKQFISDIVEALDNVITVFIDKAKKYPELKKVVNSAKNERAIGIGAMGWHALLQKRMIPFESALAVGLNKQIWSKMNKEAKEATKRLAEERGPCPDAATDGTLVRNSHLFAVAPNASSSILMDTSPSIEPYRANVYLEKGVNGTKVHKNKYLEKLLESKDKNTQAVWSDIITNDGSVRTLDFLDDYEKDVFKTAFEIDQTWLIQHASDRQEYICQAQSLNLFFDPTTDVEYLHLVHLMAWKLQLKSLYYCRSDSMRKADKVGKKVQRERIEDMKDMLIQEEDVCLACSG